MKPKWWPPSIDAALLEPEWSCPELRAAMGRDVFETPQLFELVSGKIRFKSRKSPLYAATVSLVFERVCRLGDQSHYWRTQMPLELGARDVIDPVLVEGQVRDSLEHHPRGALWVIEIADQGLEFQRQIKRPLYAHSVPEHWLMDLKSRTLEISGSGLLAGDDLGARASSLHWLSHAKHNSRFKSLRDAMQAGSPRSQIITRQKTTTKFTPRKTK